MGGATSPPTCSVIGPFVGALGDASVRVCLGLPATAHEAVTCTLEGPDGRVTKTSAPAHGAFRLFAFDFDDLDPEAEYGYSFSAATPVDLEGLRADDLRFRPVGRHPSASSLVLATCNNPFESGSDDGWAMWRRLDRLLAESGARRPRLLVLGGDQVYHDVLEREYVARLEATPSDFELRAELRRALIDNYARYWSALPFRRVVAGIPSVAMWDDHDITDGWGGRLESFTTELGFKPGWHAYFEVARDAFAAYQASRNPPPLPGVPAGSFTTRLDWGDCALYLCDFRSEKNSRQDRFWSQEQEAAFAASLSACPARLVFVVSPVVPFRADPDYDEKLTGLAKAAYNARQAARNTGIHLVRRASDWVLDSISWLIALADDLEDGLLARNNRVAFLRLLDQLMTKMENDECRVVILSGDIHAAGISEFVKKTADASLRIPQIVSSPIAHEAMPANVEGTSTARVEIGLGDDGTLSARNGPYFPDRNFAIIHPGRLRDYRHGLPVVFHLESHAAPIAMPAYLAPLASDGESGR